MFSSRTKYAEASLLGLPVAAIDLVQGVLIAWIACFSSLLFTLPVIISDESANSRDQF